jgi:hypothetical protein
MKFLHSIAKISFDRDKNLKHHSIVFDLGRLAEEIKQAVMALGRVGQQKSPSGQRSEHGLSDTGGECSGDSRVKGISPLPQHFSTGFCRKGMPGGYCSSG